MSLADCVYFPSYSVKCISYFMLRHLMTSQNLKMCNFKIWFSREQKELFKWNKKHFSYFDNYSRLDLQTSTSVVDTTFNWSIMEGGIICTRVRWVILDRASDLKTAIFLSSDRFLALHSFNTFSIFAMYFLKFLSFSSCLLYE